MVSRWVVLNKDYEDNIQLRVGSVVRNYRVSEDILNTLDRYSNIDGALYDALTFPLDVLDNLFRKKSEFDLDYTECEFYKIINNYDLDEFEASGMLFTINTEE